MNSITTNTIKDQYWKTGNILQFNTGRLKVIWNDKAIDSRGYIPKGQFNDELINTDSCVGERVVRVFSPNKNAQYFDDLLNVENSTVLWEKSRYTYTEDNVKSMLGIPEDGELIIIPT